MQKRNIKSDWQQLLLITKSPQDDPIGYSSDDISICHSIILSHISIPVMCTVTAHGSRVFSLHDYTLRQFQGVMMCRSLEEPDVILFQALTES
ncbi:hypothetical protein L2E82_16036 [Cichorium intybus]|uniref:Uncharacterized protein n=1 Tax=Cichorium intybus TaxID=13427 RepID=A0ACB9F433_CICIN|nr:hypothetical protein L2E82_16036 [Cichorium intybus]